MNDSRGKELFIGDQVVWASRSGSSCWLEHGTITGFKETKNWRGTVTKLQVLKQVPQFKYSDGVRLVDHVKPVTSYPYVMDKLLKVTGFPA